MVGRPSHVAATPGLTLPGLERLLPAPPPDLIGARIEAHSAPGEVIADPFGRGGWVARAALDRGRRAVSIEVDPLARLLAELVLRPPDLRHLDAAFQALGASPRGETSLRLSIGATFASHCPTCGRQVILDDVTWEVPRGAAGAGGAEADADADDESDGHRTDAEPSARPAPRPARKTYRCSVCREPRGRGEVRQAPVDPSDVDLALRDAASPALRATLRERFPAVDGAPGLADDLLELHSGRQLAGLAAILERIEADLRAATIDAALRLALVHALIPASRLLGVTGRMTTLRVAGGQVRRPTGSWRERNPWVAFEDGIRAIRGFLQQLESGPVGPAPARLGSDLRSLAEGAATTVLQVGGPDAFRRLVGRPGDPAGLPAAGVPKIRLLVFQPPPRPHADRVAATFHATAWALGRGAAATLSLGALVGAPGRVPWGWQAAAIRRALEAAAPTIARDGRVVILVEPGGPEALAAAALGGSAAGYRILSARLADPAEASGGSVELIPPGAPIPPRALDRANRSLAPLPGGAGDPEVVPGRGLFAPPERIDARPFSAAEAAETVTRIGVEMLKARGESAPLERLFGEVLVGLDRAGMLRRLVIAEPVGGAEDGPTESGPAAASGGGRGGAGGVESGATAGAPAGAELSPPGAGRAVAVGAVTAGRPSGDPVERLVALVRDELGNPRRGRLEEVEPGRWWLADAADRDAAQAPLADRLEWSVYSLLSTAGPIPAPAFHDRIATLFGGPDLPDEALVQACLESYRDPAAPADALTTRDDLTTRTREHGELLAELIDGGHRAGLQVWVGRREQGRMVRGRSLADRLDERERGAYLPLVVRAPVEAVGDVDCIWYVRDRVTLLFELEWTAILGELLLRRHARLPTDDRTVRFLVVPSERTELIRAKLARSPALRSALADGNWHVLKWPLLRRFLAADPPRLEDLEPFLGLDPVIERSGEQMPLFD